VPALAANAVDIYGWQMAAEEGQSASKSVDEALVAEMLAKYPTPKDTRRSVVRATDRHAVRKHIQGQLRGRR
jgi:hypothetical protein